MLNSPNTQSLVRALIHTRIDYCNRLLAAGPKYLHEKLQSVLRAASRLVLQLPHRVSVSGIMRGQLHWLEMPDRVRFKLCTTCTLACIQMSARTCSFLPVWSLDACHSPRSSEIICDKRTVAVNPRTKTKTLGPRGFYFASSAAWNALPVSVISSYLLGGFPLPPRIPNPPRKTPKIQKH